MTPDPTPGVYACAVVLPRRAVSPRQVTRAAEVWRLAQEAAVQAICHIGWPPERFRERQIGFVVAAMTTRHLRELAYGERVRARTWVRDMRRGTLTRRDVHISGCDGPAAQTTQQWVHVRQLPDGQVQIARADDDVIAALPPVANPGPAVELPAWTPTEPSPVQSTPFEIWHTWMDPIGHLNHPIYVDLCDEATSRLLATVGADPQQLVPVAERVRFRQAALAGDQVSVETTLQGFTPTRDAVLRQKVRRQDGVILADATTVRRLVDGSDGLERALRSTSAAL